MEKKNVIIVVCLFLAVAGIAYGTTFHRGTEESASLGSKKIGGEGAVRFNCEQSGGSYTNNVCACPTEGDDASVYEESSGFCMTAFGSPAGALGQDARARLELQMEANK